MVQFDKFLAKTPEGIAFISAWRAQEAALLALARTMAGEEFPANTDRIEALRRQYIWLSDVASLALHRLEIHYDWPPKVTYGAEVG